MNYIEVKHVSQYNTIKSIFHDLNKNKMEYLNFIQYLTEIKNIYLGDSDEKSLVILSYISNKNNGKLINKHAITM